MYDYILWITCGSDSMLIPGKDRMDAMMHFPPDSPFGTKTCCFRSYRGELTEEQISEIESKGYTLIPPDAEYKTKIPKLKFPEKV
jgi:hypothetical protein